MANTGARLKPEAVRIVAFGSITAVLTQLGAPLLGPARVVRFQNTTDVPLYFSVTIPGITPFAQFYMVPNSFLLLDCKTNDGFFNTDELISVAAVSALPTLGSAIAEVIYS